jgi:hypothetical protein
MMLHEIHGVCMTRQVSVPLTQELREYVERAAEREDRSVAGQIRHLVAEAARRERPRPEAA